MFQSLGIPARRNLDPFLMLHQFSTDDPDGYIAGFPDHLHRGFNTFILLTENRMWDQRYSTETYAYGTEPNDFLVAKFGSLPAGRVLCLGEGEGRNAVWLAQQGREVTAMDASEIGLQKARWLANERGVKIQTVHADLAAFEIQPQHWDVIVSIFCHLMPELRCSMHRRCVEGLRPGGVMLLEAYTPAQLEYRSGGPPTAEMMMDAESLRNELAGLEFIHLQECVREVREGEFHNGAGAVVQILARKP